MLTDAVTGGTWSSSNTAVATINSTTGLATAQLINGVAIITYSLTDSVCGIISTSTELPVVAELTSDVYDARKQGGWRIIRRLCNNRRVRDKH